jgi:hypothetical protein
MQKVSVDFFQFSRDGLMFLFQDSEGDPLNPLDTWTRLEVVVFKKLNYLEPLLTIEPYIDDNVVSVAFTSEQIKEFFQSADYRIEIRAFTGSDYDTLFYYQLELENIYS